MQRLSVIFLFVLMMAVKTGEKAEGMGENAAATTGSGRTGAPPADLKVNPEEVGIGILYDGATVDVSARTAKGRDIAIMFIGPGNSISLKKKGKVGGILWMNVGDIEYEDVPSLYLVKSSKKLDALAPSDVLEKLDLGYEALRARIDGSDSKESQENFAEFINLEESLGLFSLEEESIHPAGGNTDTEAVTAEFSLPAKVPIGKYDIRLFEFADGTGWLASTRQFEIKRTMVISFVNSLAFSHGLLYGFLAVIIAIGAGLLTGLIFGRGKGSH